MHSVSNCFLVTYIGPLLREKITDLLFVLVIYLCGYLDIIAQYHLHDSLHNIIINLIMKACQFTNNWF